MLSFNKYLNPLYRGLDEIADFSNIKAENTLEEEEFPYLIHLLGLSLKQINSQKDRMLKYEKEIEDQVAIIEQATGDDKQDAVKVYNQLLRKVFSIIDRINRELDIIDNPYFGKIVFKREAFEKYPAGIVTSYIGKFAYFDEESKKVLVTDWRAPIANIYYTNSGPKDKVNYRSPIGILHGDLVQKRQFEIQNGRIRHIYDAKSGNISADEFLLAQLNRRIGKKLAEIVATIQEQQNDIIRDEINKPVILQGVAGSGKTTIVLHRLAYLFYTYPKEISASKSLIMAPNRMFLDYISNVLPSLGIKGVEANTYIFWAKKILGLSNKHTLSNEPINLDIRKQKGTLEFINKLEKFFDKYEQQLLDELPYSGNDKIAQRYFDLKKEYPKIFLNERLELAIDSVFQSNEVNLALRKTAKEISDNTKEKIEKYVKSKTEVKNIYKEFINSKEFNSLELANYTHKTFTRNTFTQEDLPPLLWIYFKLNGYEQHMRDYIVIDEAQDMSIFEIYTLLLISKKNNIFLAGDLAQSIIPPFHIHSWDQLKELISEKIGVDTTYYQINKCYRTTIEVIEYANNILKNYFPKSYELPEAVLRHGDAVKEITTKDIVEVVNKQFELGSATVALICKDENESNKLYLEMKAQEKNLSNSVYTYSDADYKTGILVLPIRKAKGLEFDSVIVMNSNKYNMENELDSRQFYVGVTRALHRLYIHNDEN